MSTRRGQSTQLRNKTLTRFDKITSGLVSNINSACSLGNYYYASAVDSHRIQSQCDNLAGKSKQKSPTY